MAFVKSDLFCARRRDLEQRGFEIMWLDFELTHRNRLLTAVCCQAPNCAAADRFLFRMCCSNVINNFLSDASTTILFVGDFNDQNHSSNKLRYFVYLTGSIFTKLYNHPLGALIF